MPKANSFLPPADHPAAVIFESMRRELPLRRYAELRSSNPRHLRDFEDVKDFVQFGDAEDVILVMDPPDHTRLRRLVAPSFTPGALAGLELWIRRRVDELLEAVTSDTFDLVEGFSEPFPIGVIAELLGVDKIPASRLGRDLIVGNDDPVRPHRRASTRRPATVELTGSWPI